MMRTGNGHSLDEALRATHAFQAGVDDLENAETTAQERDDCLPPPVVYDCPPRIWHGGFLRVAEAVGQATWEVWMGAACAFGALAARNIHVNYHGKLYGPFYGLLIKATGTGKSICTNTFRALLPPWYSVSGAVQSGPALMPICAEIARDEGGKITGCRALPAALIIPEWTRLAKNLKLQHSTLQEDMNEIADGLAWNISRSESNKTGGGNMVLTDPTLTVCATTTESLFTEEVTTRMIRAGFINRYLILPGTRNRWQLYDPAAAGIDFARLHPVRDSFLSHPHTLGLGTMIWDLYEPAAFERWLSWGQPLFEGIMNSLSPEVEIYKRLHAHTHRLCLLYAWADSHPRVTLAHLEAVIPVVETSLRYLENLMGDIEPYMMPSVRFEIEGKEKVAQKIKKESGKVDQMKLSQDLRKSLRSSDIAKFVKELISEGYVKKKDNRWLQWVQQ